MELEKGAFDVVGNDWQARLDRTFLDNLGKYRKYDGKSVQDLMRALRNKVSDLLFGCVIEYSINLYAETSLSGLA